jgi:hypothetical protein
MVAVKQLILAGGLMPAVLAWTAGTPSQARAASYMVDQAATGERFKVRDGDAEALRRDAAAVQAAGVVTVGVLRAGVILPSRGRILRQQAVGFFRGQLEHEIGGETGWRCA